MKVSEFAKYILSNGKLQDKLISVESISEFDSSFNPVRFPKPLREGNLTFSEEQVKFPKKGALKNKNERGKALHFFANHELLAIEMMAQALLLFPNLGEKSQKLLLKTISEEQTHMSLYIRRMEDFGVSFGDYPLNDFFWSYMEKVQTIEEFFSVISLTFEQANLDFCLHYMNVFKELGDNETADILEIIYRDEIKHVARGRLEVDERREFDETLWEYYQKVLPEPLSPARAKGIGYDKEGRRKAGFEDQFIKNLEDFRDDFSVTNRRQWKK